MSSTNEASFTFSDLFAGIGGFHAALQAAGGTWKFASEIDPAAKAVYDHNWLRPLREAGAELPEGVEEFRVSDDIVDLTEPDGGDPDQPVRVPHSDVLAAGFPCQPFSKSGFQRGMAETRGTLFWNIARILADDEARPSVVLLENVRNLAGPRHRDTTFATIRDTLRELGYRTAEVPAVFSPHLLPPELGGRPQVRERVFILAHYVGVEKAQDPASFDAPIVTAKSVTSGWTKEQWDLEKHLPLLTDDEAGSSYALDETERLWIRTWDSLLTAIADRLGPDDRLPGFPIWLYPFGEYLGGVSLEDYVLEAERQSLADLPGWKRNFYLKNWAWFEAFDDLIEEHWDAIRTFPRSRQKFEWQAGPHRPLAETIMHFRPSGIRCKRPDYVPALVAITQTSVLGHRRRLTPRETARLQGLPDWFEFKHPAQGQNAAVLQKDPASYKQMGNGVNVGAAYFVFRRYVDAHRDEIPDHIVTAVDAAPDNPDMRLAERLTH